MSEDVVILGAGRHGRNVLDVLLASGQTVVGFLDDTKAPGTRVNGVPVIGGFGEWHTLLEGRRFIVAVGDNEARRTIHQSIVAAGSRLANAVHPSCAVSGFARLGAGIYLGSFTRVMANATVGDHALVEGLCSIGTDGSVGEAAWLGPGCQLTGRAHIGAGAFVGAGAIIVGPVTVGARSVVGAGATVIRDVPPDVLVAGVPAVVKRRLR